MAEGLGFLIYRYFIYSTDHTKIGGCGLYGLLNKSNSSILETLNRKPSTIIHEPQRGVWHTSRLVGDGHPPASRAVPPQSGRSLTIRARSVHNIMLFLFVQKNILQQSVAVCVYIYIYIYIERERGREERERERERERKRERERERERTEREREI